MDCANPKKIFLTQGKFAIVDEVDYRCLCKYSWCANKDKNTYYAIRAERKNGILKCVKMHREILGLTKGDGIKVDHINHNGLDNRRCNLRICTYSQNNQNRRSFCGTSIYKGVRWHSRDNKWYAAIQYNGKTRHLGIFADEQEAAKAYDNAAKKIFGEFANTNFVGQPGYRSMHSPAPAGFYESNGDGSRYPEKV